MGSNEYKLTYNVDLVFCIDSTRSMDNVIDIVKANALNFYEDLMTTIKKKNKVVNKLRIKIISFRDYIADGDQAMLVTDFFTLPEEKEDFRDAVSMIVADGGGDDPEDGLEALAYAIRSDWDNEATRSRQVIVVWSDEATHPLGFGASSPHYPQNMAKDFTELTEWWGTAENSPFTKYNSKRLLLFTPDAPFWNSISQSWGFVLHFKSEAGKGLDDVSYEQILNAIINSI